MATPASRSTDLAKIGQQLTHVPEGFNVHKTVKRFMDNRLAAIESGEGIDWATAEALAFGTLVTEGHPVRLSGQDVERGTFSQRHSVLNDQPSTTRAIPRSTTSDRGPEPLRGHQLDALAKRRCSASSMAIRWPSRRR